MANAIVIGAQWEALWPDVAYFVVAAMLLVFLVRSWRKRRKSDGHYGQTMGDPTVPVVSTEGDAAPEKMSLGMRFFAIGFFGLWLIIWTAGCYMAGRAWLGLSFGDEGYIFLLIWLALAVPAWFVVAGILVRLLRGDHVELSFDGDDSGGGD